MENNQNTKHHYGTGKLFFNDDFPIKEYRDRAITIAEGLYLAFKHEKGKNITNTIEYDADKDFPKYKFNIVIPYIGKDTGVITVRIYFTKSIYYEFAITFE